MSGDILNLRVTIITPVGQIVVSITPRASERVADLMARLIIEHRLAGTPENWQLLFEGRALAHDHSLRDELPVGTGVISLTFSPTGVTIPQGIPGLPGSSRRSEPSLQLPPGAPEPRGFGTDFDEAAPAAECAPAPQQAPPPAPASVPRPAPMARSGAAAPTPTRSAGSASPASEKMSADRYTAPTGGMARRMPSSTTERRATVRYYSRMNPDRVFPLLVVLTREEVERVVKQHVEQRATGPITLAKDVPLEVEPVLPGCQCHPPRVVNRLGDGNDVFTFHIVPHVLGEVTGARVLIRQDHATVAEVPLDMRVVQRTLVVASGLSTFLVPAASAAMNHFGLDFKPKGGGNPYMAALNFLFGEVSPVLLTVALAAVTLGLYFYTRPKGRDVFFDITTKPAK